MGGYESGNTSEIALVTGIHSEQHFDLKYDTRDACAIELELQVVVTGGYNTASKVTVYNEGGFQEELPELLMGRSSHGCGHYTDAEGNLVFVISGGFGNNTRLSSTE